MVRGDHQVVFRPHPHHQLPKLYIHLIQGVHIPVNIVAVAIEHIEIHQVDEAKPCEIFLQDFHRLLHILLVSLVGIRSGQPFPGENILDLPHADHLVSRRLQCVQDGLSGRFQREIMTVYRPLVIRISPYKGPGDHPPHSMLTSEDSSCLAAVFIKLLQRDHLFMGGDLKDAVRGSIDDQIPGPLLLPAVFFDHFRPGIGLVAEHAPAGGFGKCIDDLLGKAVGIRGKWFPGDQSGDLPVSHGSVFAHRVFPHSGVTPFHPGNLFLKRRPFQTADTKLLQIGHMKFSAADAGAKGIAAHIVKKFRVRSLPYANTVQYDKKYPFPHSFYSLLLSLS